MPRLKRWNGSEYVNADIRSSDGSAYEKKPLMYWDGTKHVNILEQEYNIDYTPTNHQNYWTLSGSKENNYPTRHYHGSHNGTSSAKRGSMIFFNIEAIQADLAGAEIDDVRLYLDNLHSYYSTGMTVVICSHDKTTEPTSWSYKDYNIDSLTINKGQNLWYDLPNSFAEGLRDGTLKGIALYPSSNSTIYYGYFDAAKTKLNITFRK